MSRFLGKVFYLIVMYVLCRLLLSVMEKLDLFWV